MNEQIKKNLRTAVENFWGAASPEGIALDALLARQSAAIDKQEAVCVPVEPTEAMIRAACLNQSKAQFSTYEEWFDSHSSGVAERIRDLVTGDYRAMLAAAPLANEASKPAAQSDDNDEACSSCGLTMGESRLLAHLKANPAAPSVEQDERGAWFALADGAAASLENAAVCMTDPDAKRSAEGAAAFVRKRCREILDARAASTSANVAQGAEAVAQMHIRGGEMVAWINIGLHEGQNDLYAAPPAQTAVTDAARDVLAERQRQVIAEGWTPMHDDEHETGELARAAACYAANATGYRLQSRINIWPWDREWWKPTTPRRDLVKAGALILAEVERLDRRALTAAQSALTDRIDHIDDAGYVHWKVKK
jgi:hypothetical protein